MVDNELGSRGQSRLWRLSPHIPFQVLEWPVVPSDPKYPDLRDLFSDHWDKLGLNDRALIACQHCALPHLSGQLFDGPDIDPHKAQVAASPCYSVRWEKGETNLEPGTVGSRSIKAVVSAAFFPLVRKQRRHVFPFVLCRWRHAKWRTGLRNSEPLGGWGGGWSSSQSCVGRVAYVWIYSHGNMMSVTSDRFLSVKLCQLDL